MKFIFLTLLLCLLPLWSGAEPTKAEFEAALAEDPDNPAALYNLGLFCYLDGDYAACIPPWEKLMALDPEDWQLRAKLIQAYSAAGQGEKRDALIAELYRMRKSGDFPELSAEAFFIRDQFKVGDIEVFVFEYYDMDAGFYMGPLKWKFYLQQDGEQKDRFISLGSYEGTTQIAREMGDIGPNDRMYHLDEYWGRGNHATLGFYKQVPDYDLVRQQVIKTLEGKAAPLSTTTRER